MEKDLHTLEKIIWIAIAFLLPIIGPLIYYIIVKRKQQRIFKGEELPFKFKENELDKLEKLNNLKEKGAITEEEYKKAKQKIMEKL